MTTFTDVFGSSTLPPSEFGYSALTLSGDKTVVWPYNSDSASVSISKIVDITCAAGNVLTLPDAMLVSTGEDFLLRNTGSNTLIVHDAGGTQIAMVSSGAASYFYLTSNTTVAGVYGVIGFGVGTSSVDASSLVGYGIKAVGATLNQSHPVVTIASSTSVIATHRAQLLSFTGGAASWALDDTTVLGNDFFVLIRNNGTGTLTIDPYSGELIDKQSTLQLQPGESLIAMSTGAGEWFTVGYGRSTLYQFTQLTKDVSAGGTITLTAAEASNKLLTFIGNPAASVTVVVPAVVSIYYTYSNISTPQTVTIKTASGSGSVIPQSARIIVICDGTNVLSAQSAVANSSLSLTDGAAATPSLYFATATDSGIYKYGTNGIGFAVGGVDVFHLDSSGFTVTTPWNIASGGTGANTAPLARTALGISAANTPNTPAGNIVATDVQAALNELDSEKQALVTASGILKGNGSGTLSAASGTDVTTLIGANAVTNAVNVTGTVAVANGGTGGTTAAAARTGLGIGDGGAVNTASNAVVLNASGQLPAVDASLLTGIASGYTGFRNKIINGNFSVNQRLVSGTVTLSAGAYGHDRFKAGAGGCTYTFATSLGVTTLTISSGTLQQVIEGNNLFSGAHILSWVGTATGRVDSGSYGASGVVGTAVGGTNQTVEFSTGTLSKVQYEPGSVITPFENRLIGLEQYECRRRCRVIPGNEFIASGTLRAGGAGSYLSGAAAVGMASAPSVTYAGTALQIYCGDTAVTSTAASFTTNGNVTLTHTSVGTIGQAVAVITGSTTTLSCDL